MKKITVGLFGTNTYLIVEDNNCVLVDPGLEFKSVLNDLSKYNVVGILLTHGHLDHIDGIGYFDCPIYIHELDLEMILDKDKSLYSMIGGEPSFNKDKLNIKTFKDGDVISLLKEDIKVIHTPGHSMGSSCFLYKTSLFTGDTLFKGSAGRTDFYGGNHIDLVKSLKMLVNTFDGNTKVYPGHDSDTTIKTEKQFNYFII